MQIFTMVVLVVAIACGTAVVIEYLKNRRLALKASAAQAATLERLDALAERLAAVEAIVTDDGYGLAQEIGRLERRA